MFDLAPTDTCEESIASAALAEARMILEGLPEGPCRTRLACRLAIFEETLRRWRLADPGDAERRRTTAAVLDFFASLVDLNVAGAMCPTNSDVGAVGGG